MKDIALIGCGYWGRNLARNLSNLGKLAVVCDSNTEIKTAVQRDYPGVGFRDSVDSVLSDEDIKSVVIASPASTHYSIARKALLSGKDVFVEKPLSLRLEEGEELARISEERKRILMVGHVLRYHPAVTKLKDMIDGGELGKVQYIYSNRLNIGKLRTEENILWSFAPHDISVMLDLVGEEPVKVSSFGGCYLNSGIYDTTLTTLEFPGNTKGHIFVSWLHPYKEQRLVVVGSGKMAVFNDCIEEKLVVYPHTIKWKDGRIPVAHRAPHEVIPVGGEEPLRAELEHFMECSETGRTPRTDAREGIRVLRVLQKAGETLKRGRHEDSIICI